MLKIADQSDQFPVNSKARKQELVFCSEQAQRLIHMETEDVFTNPIPNIIQVIQSFQIPKSIFFSAFVFR